MNERFTIDGTAVELDIRINRRAKRISLKVDPVAGAAILVLPSKRSRADGITFAESRAGWLRAELSKIPARTRFADGAVIPFLGRSHRIQLVTRPVGGVWRDGGTIFFACRAEHLPRRVRDWLKAEARRLISDRVAILAAEVGRRPLRITLRDPKSRWGSCTEKGSLSFSWRLVLAPTAVLDYVVAHEVAHLAHLDHSAAFWKVVAGLHPGYATDRRWLKEKGAELHRYG